MKLIFVAATAVLGLSSSSAVAQAQRVYDLGPVVAVTHVKVQPAQLNAYMASLNSVWRKGLDDRKRRGEVLSYGVYQNMAPGVGEPNMMLVVTYKNAAVMDTPLDELDRRNIALQGSLEAADKASENRERIRTVLGNDLLRELRFK
jgi:hypothetical protein